MKTNNDMTFLPINEWSELDRPREKLLNKGKESLAEAELLAILIGSGSRKESAVDLCRRILQNAGNNLNHLARYDIQALLKFKGIGEAKAISIIAALELGRRRQATQAAEKPLIRSSKAAFDLIGAYLSDLDHEEFWILILNQQCKLIKKMQISKGGVASTYVDQRIIWKHVLQNLGSSIILIHNHPSGGLIPSRQDLLITKTIVDSGKQLGIKVNDHLIIGGKDYYSFSDEGESCMR